MNPRSTCFRSRTAEPPPPPKEQKEKGEKTEPKQVVRFPSCQILLPQRDFGAIHTQTGGQGKCNVFNQCLRSMPSAFKMVSCGRPPLPGGARSGCTCRPEPCQPGAARGPPRALPRARGPRPWPAPRRVYRRVYGTQEASTRARTIFAMRYLKLGTLQTIVQRALYTSAQNAHEA
jgi:hypothetical protein